MGDSKSISDPDLQKRLASAITQHERGNLAAAEAEYRQVLALRPNHPETLHRLGILAYQVGRLDVAADLIQRAASWAPGEARFHANLASVLNDLGKPSEALVAAGNAIRLDPSLSGGHLALGVAHQNLRQYELARLAFEEAIRRDPSSAAAYTNLGSALSSLGQTEQAISAHRAAVLLSPNMGVAHYNLGVLLKQSGDLAGALAALEAAVRIYPKLYEARIHLGLAFELAQRFDDAGREYQVAIDLNATRADGYNNLANLLLRSDQPARALELYQKLLARDPRNVTALGNLANALKDQGQLDESLDAHRRALEIDPAQVHIHSSLLLLLQHHPKFNPAQIGDESRAWAARHAEPLAKIPRDGRLAGSSGGKLRIGYLSGDFREHYIGRVALSLMEHHDAESFEVHCYSNSRREDDVTRATRAAKVHWRDITTLDDQSAAELIARDAIDVLIDLSSHTAGGRPLVFARRPAPVQVMWLAYPGTTGMSTMDYRITDRYLDPPGENDAFYSEKSVYLPHCYWLLNPRGDSAEVTPLPALSNGRITFGSFNTFSKVNEEMIQRWAEVLKAVADSRLLILAPPGEARQRVARSFTSLGVAEERVEFVGRVPRSEYLKYYQQTDVVLDTFPWNGHTTSLDALWMGVPTISLVGRGAMSRGGLSVLSNLGLTELAASSVEAYVRTATELSRDLGRLAEMRLGLRQRMQNSPIMDPIGYTRDAEQIYRNIAISKRH